MLQAATLQEQVEALGKSGYATDPEYADKVMAIAKSKRLEVLWCSLPRLRFQKATQTTQALRKASVVNGESYAAQMILSHSIKLIKEKNSQPSRAIYILKNIIC